MHQLGCYQAWMSSPVILTFSHLCMPLCRWPQMSNYYLSAMDAIHTVHPPFVPFMLA